MPIQEVLSYNILKRTYFLYEIVKDKKVTVIDEVLNILDFLPVKDIPFLFPEVCVEGKLDTAFDRAFSLDQPRSTV